VFLSALIGVSHLHQPVSCDRLDPMPRGTFITFEGLDGSGKTTQMQRLAAWLTSLGHSVVTLRQPGSTALGDRLRTVLLDSRSESALGPISPLAEMSLMFADRAQAIAEIIEPALATGSIVLCDRYTDSSEAYQGAGRQLGSQRILAMHTAVCNNLQPDLTLLLLPPLEDALERARRRNHRKAQSQKRSSNQPQSPDENRFERESDAFYARIRRLPRASPSASSPLPIMWTPTTPSTPSSCASARWLRPAFPL
jgi:dTMP kinase